MYAAERGALRSVFWSSIDISDGTPLSNHYCLFAITIDARLFSLEIS